MAKLPLSAMTLRSAASAAVEELASSYLAARWGGVSLPPDSARLLLRKLESALRPS